MACGPVEHVVIANPSSHPTPRSFPLPTLWLIVLVQAALHLAVLPFGGLINGTVQLQRWATTLLTHPVSQFYAREKDADHLPGDLWILKLEAGAYQLISGHSPANQGFLNALKLGPGLADIGLTVTLYLIAREIDGERAGRRAAACFALNPTPIVIAMIWGIADAVSLLFAAIALLLVLQGRVWASGPVLAYACLIKPQLAILAPMIVIYVVRTAWDRSGSRRFVRPAIDLCVAGLASAAIVFIVILPFDMGISVVHGRWSLRGRLEFAANAYTRTTLNAPNLWAWFAASRGMPTIHGVSDQVAGPLGVTYQLWGILFTVIACLILTLPVLRWGGQARLVRASTAILFAFFMLQTRIHERYFFPAIGLMAVAAALRRRWMWVYLVMASVYFITNVVVYRGSYTRDAGVHRAFGHLTSPEVRVLVVANLVVLAFLGVDAVGDLRASSEDAPRGVVAADRRPLRAVEDVAGEALSRLKSMVQQRRSVR